MTESAFDRYKDALRRGHVAALRGRLDEALAAYDEAAALAPDRTLPLTSRGGVLARMTRHDEALEAFERALARIPGEEAASAGRAEALASLGRRNDAALAFDHLADRYERSERLTEATDSARRALELAESRARRGTLAALAERLAGSSPDERATKALERARAMLRADATSTAAEAVPAAAAGPPPVDTVTLTRRAEEAMDIGDTASARQLLLELAEAHRAAGRIDAALDASYLALSIAPGNVDLHLALVGLYLERGWRAPALEKVRLLGTLVELSDDPRAPQKLQAVLAERFGDLGMSTPGG
jgi:tetratricopeptide (TPR) repeat protein